MEITNEQTEETPRLRIADLGVAAWACSELFNYMLEGYEQEDYGELSKEQMETSIFIGPVFYQRLKHMVSDKVHSRATGPARISAGTESCSGNTLPPTSGRRPSATSPSRDA